MKAYKKKQLLLKLGDTVNEHYYLTIILVVFLIIFLAWKDNIEFTFVHFLTCMVGVAVGIREGVKAGMDYYKPKVRPAEIAKYGDYKVPIYIKRFMVDCQDLIDNSRHQLVAHTNLRLVVVIDNFSEIDKDHIVSIPYESIESFPTNAIAQLDKEYTEYNGG